jgi:tRNA threonylcarbamoyl adenosine modification protein (Sua5/YciO/YrdC/YwlC family)
MLHSGAMQRFAIHPDNPQARHIKRAATGLRAGNLMVYPTDTTYGLGCDIYAKRSIDRIYQLKGMDPKHPLSFVCGDLSEVARYAVLDNRNFQILRRTLPGKYTFVLPATREVPKLMQSGRRTVGIRIPQSAVCAALIAELGHPLVSTTVSRDGAEPEDYSNDPDKIAADFARAVDLFLDVGPLVGEPSSVVDLTGPQPEVLRHGSGDLSWL